MRNFIVCIAWSLAFVGIAMAADFTCDNLTVTATQRQNTNSIASGAFSTAEGAYTKAYGSYAHVEGLLSEASGSVAHAEGYITKASAAISHAGGYYAQTLSTHTGAFIHASGTAATNKVTLYRDTAHFDRLILFESANNNPSSVLARWESDVRYARLSYLAPQGDLAMGVYTNGP